MFINGKLFDISIEFVLLRFKLYTSNRKLPELLYFYIETQLEIFIANEFQCFVLTKMDSQNMITIILKNTYVKVTRRWYKNSTIKKKT